jgi:hypothetical protein
MADQITRVCWIIAALFVLGGLISKLFDVTIFSIYNPINYFHAANTALLFGILFSLQREK